MGNMDFDAVRRLSDDFYRVASQFPEARRALMRELGQAMLGAVRGGIGGTGKVQSWQEKYLGSGGGYAAVRPRAKTYQATLGGRRYAVGYITGAIERGHPVRGPGGYSKRYRPRLHKTYVAGKGAYGAAGAQIEPMVLQAAQDMLGRLSAELEG